jgi:hypothetical protein
MPLAVAPAAGYAKRQKTKAKRKSAQAGCLAGLKSRP